jgi:hypothetical protein
MLIVTAKAPVTHPLESLLFMELHSIPQNVIICIDQGGLMDTFKILPAEHVGQAAHDKDGFLTIGTGNKTVKIYLNKGDKPGWWNTGTVDVYVRRMAHDLSVCEILIAQHDGYAQEELDMENEEAERYPLGPKEYWRSKMVGKFTCEQDGHSMTNEDFEKYWNEDND